MEQISFIGVEPTALIREITENVKNSLYCQNSQKQFKRTNQNDTSQQMRFANVSELPNQLYTNTENETF